MKNKLLIIVAMLLAACSQPMEEPTMAVSITNSVGNVLLSGNPIWVELTGSAPAGATRHNHLLRIVSTDGALVGSPLIDTIPVPATNVTLFNIMGRVNQAVSYDFEYPFVNKVIEHPQLAFDITLEAGQEYIDSNGDKQTVWSGVTQAHRVLKGGLSRYKQMTMLPADFYDDFVKDGRFLTWQADNQVISPSTPVKLWFISPLPTAMQLKVIVVVNYSTGQAVNDFTPAFNIDPDKLYELNFSMALWSFLAISPLYGPAVNMQVGIFNGEEAVMDYRTYYFDHNFYEENTFIFFKNSIGGVDPLWCSGQVTELINTKSNIVSRPDTLEDYTYRHRPTQVVSSVTGQRKWEINSGFKSKAELIELRDFALSDQIWLIYNGKKVPVILENRDLVLQQISRELDSIEFTLIEAHVENFY